MRETIQGAVATQKASKHHPCSACPMPILAGNQYRRVILDSGKVLRFHIACYTREFPETEAV